MLPTPHPEPKIAVLPLSARVREWITERRLPGAIQGRIDKLLRHRLKTVRRAGYRFRVRRLTSDESFVENVAVRREYNPPGFEIREGDVVVDVGGNIGTFAVQAAQNASKVITIEPQSDNFRLLETNLVLNRCRNVTPIRAAVCGEPGIVTLNVSREGGYHSVLSSYAGIGTETVAAIRLQDVLPERCHFLKVDCEGAEHEIFRTLPAECFARIDRIAMEWHGPDDREERIAQASQLVDRLIAGGFHIEQFTEFVGFRAGMLFAKR